MKKYKFKYPIYIGEKHFIYTTEITLEEALRHSEEKVREEAKDLEWKLRNREMAACMGGNKR